MYNKIIALVIIFTFISPIASATDKLYDSSINQIEKKSHIGSEIIEMINKINESLLYEYLKQLTDIGPRYTGSDNCKIAAKYLNDEFENLGLYSFIQPWKFLRRKCQNVVATLNGTDTSSDAVFIICAHYDTIIFPLFNPNIEPSVGANDDGSGIAAMMAIANVFSQSSFNHTIKFIAFSGEEVGLFGSHYYASNAYENDENIIAVLNLDTIGYSYTEKEGNIFKLWLLKRSEWIYDFVTNICEKYNEFFNFQVRKVPTFGCDHGPFIYYGYDGVLFGQYASPDGIHSANDTIDKINFTYLEKLTKCVLATLYELANEPITLQIRIINPREGYLHIFDRKPKRLPQFNLFRLKYNGLTFIFGKTTAKVEVKLNEEIESILFTLDGETIPNPNISNKTEWEINGFTRPLFGRHILGVYVYTSSGKIAYDEMDLFIATLNYDFKFIFPIKQH
jgi:hypothetical protein